MPMRNLVADSRLESRRVRPKVGVLKDEKVAAGASVPGGSASAHTPRIGSALLWVGMLDSSSVVTSTDIDRNAWAAGRHDQSSSTLQHTSDKIERSTKTNAVHSN